jgi:hypothetical protein
VRVDARLVGFGTDLPLVQRLNDVMGLEVGDGTPEIMKGVIARERWAASTPPTGRERLVTLDDGVEVDVRDDGVAGALSRPPVNALGDALVAGLGAACDRADAAGIGVMVVCSALPGYFVAGADLHLLDGRPRRSSATSTGCAASSTGCGGAVVVAGRRRGRAWRGLELAMACTLRVASTRARLGVPE